ncbi:MAG: hypothetical protein AB1758_30475, partial [Candidatus Eremiobacterota bacterium]
GLHWFLTRAGVQAEQNVGQAFQAGLTGQAATDQLNRWRLGQAVSLVEAGHPDFAGKVLGGGFDRLAGESTVPVVRDELSTISRFHLHYRDAGATVEGADPRVSIRPADVDGKPVAFLWRNQETGKLEERRGTLRAEDWGSALFKLEGDETTYNHNDCNGYFAVLPHAGIPPVPPRQADAPKPVDPQVKSFEDHYLKHGLQVRGRTFRFEATAADMNGKFVAFLQRDPDSGGWVEVRGKVIGPSDSGSALFQVEGYPGREFNNNHIQHLALQG